MKVKSNYLRMADGGELVSRWASRQPMQGAGEVPGSGRGDKIPALYEPGESVVSNDMMQAAPGLREGLRSLRGEVLAQKGTTPEEADAKALTYDGAQEGGPNERKNSAVPVASQFRTGDGREPQANLLRGQPAYEADADRYSPGRALRDAQGSAAPLTLRADKGFELVPVPGTGDNGYRPNFTIGQEPPVTPRPEVAKAAERPAFVPVTPEAKAAAEASKAARATQDALTAQQAPVRAAPPSGVPTGGPSSSGAAADVGAKNFVSRGVSSVSDAGEATGKAIKGAIGPTLRYGSSLLGVLPHAAMYADPNVSLGDKFRVGGTDALRAAGAAVGGTFGAGAGSVVPVAGTLAGAIGGGYAGDRAGHAAGNFLFDGDAAMTRNGYDPKRSIVDTGADLLDGKGVGVALGGKAGAPAAAPGTSAKPAAAAAAAPVLTGTSAGAAPAVAAPAAAPAQPQIGQPYSPLRAGTPEYAAAAKMIDDSDVYVPRGTGAMRNNSTGRITSFDSRSYAPTPGPTQDQLRRAYAPTQYAAPAAPAAPALREKPTGWIGEMRQRKDDRLEADRALQRRNTDENNATSRFNNENTNATTTYGNELTSNSNRNRLRYDAMVGERAYQDSRYDKSLEQGRAANQDAVADFKGLFSTTKADGSVVDRPDLEAQAKLIVDRATKGGYSGMSSTERARYRNDAISYVSILDSARKNQNNTWLQAVGLSAADTPYGGLPPPDQLSKATLDVVGFVEGKTTPGTSAGARVLRFPGSKPIYLDNLSGEHLKFLKDHGVQIGATK